MSNPSVGQSTDTDSPELHSHEAILQLLNRQVGDDYFPEEPFADTVERWNEIPIVFASEHPDLAAFEKDPQAELARLRETTGKRAEIVGSVRNARIERAGHPKLMGELVHSDPEVFQLVEAGKLSHSTGFWCGTDGNSLKGSVIPNHLLVFEEDAINQPRDRGAVILNKQTGMTAFTNEGRVMSGKNLTKFQTIMESLQNFFNEITGTPGTEPDEPEPVQNKEPEIINQEPEPEPIINMSAELESKISALETENETYKNKISELEGKLAEIDQASKDAAWVSLKNKLPPGMVRTPEKEAETRELFEKDGFAFTNMLLDLRRGETKDEQGEQFTNKGESGFVPVSKPAIPGTLH